MICDNKGVAEVLNGDAVMRADSYFRPVAERVGRTLGDWWKEGVALVGEEGGVVEWRPRELNQMVD